MTDLERLDLYYFGSCSLCMVAGGFGLGALFEGGTVGLFAGAAAQAFFWSATLYWRKRYKEAKKAKTH